MSCSSSTLQFKRFHQSKLLTKLRENFDSWEGYALLIISAIFPKIPYNFFISNVFNYKIWKFRKLQHLKKWWHLNRYFQFPLFFKIKICILVIFTWFPAYFEMWKINFGCIRFNPVLFNLCAYSFFKFQNSHFLSNYSVIAWIQKFLIIYGFTTVLVSNIKHFLNILNDLPIFCFIMHCNYHFMASSTQVFSTKCLILMFVLYLFRSRKGLRQILLEDSIKLKYSPKVLLRPICNGVQKYLIIPT